MTEETEMSENENTGAEVSSTPYLDPDKRIKMTEEPQAQTALGGHAVPKPGHLRVLSAEGIGERPNGGKAGANTADFEPTPPDAPPAKVVAGGGTVGPDGVDNPLDGTTPENASTVSEHLNTEVTQEPKKATRKTSPRKTAKKSAGSGAGTTSKEK